MTTLRQAAEAVVDSWDATYIAALRTALEAPEPEPEIKVLRAKCDAFFANTQLALEELEDMTAKRDIAIRKLSVLDNAHFLENLYEVGLNQERDITRLTAERDAYQRAADSMAMAHKVERDELMAAAKLALEACVEFSRAPITQVEYLSLLRVIAALKAAGVK